jgi:hypothetical protein
VLWKVPEFYGEASLEGAGARCGARCGAPGRCQSFMGKPRWKVPVRARPREARARPRGSAAQGECQHFPGRPTNEVQDRLQSDEWLAKMTARTTLLSKNLSPSNKPGPRLHGQNSVFSDGDIHWTDSSLGRSASSSAHAVVFSSGQAGALNGKGGGKDQRGNISFSSCARSRKRRAPARKASTKAR